MPKIYILIPVFKRLEHTINFIESCKQYITESKNFVIIDDSPKFEHFFHFKNNMDIIVLKGTGNLWWGGSINLGMEYLFSLKLHKENIIIWANNDCIIDKNTFINQKNHLERNKDAFFHPRVYDLKSNCEVPDCGVLKTWIPIRCKYIHAQNEDLTICNLVSARFLMSYFKNFKKVGLIASNIPHYGGDWDYSLRAEKLGLKTFLTKNSFVKVNFDTTGVRYEKGISLKVFINSVFSDIKSPQNIYYKFQLIKNHNSLFIRNIAIIMEFLKTIKYYGIHSFNIYKNHS